MIAEWTLIRPRGGQLVSLILVGKARKIIMIETIFLTGPGENKEIR